jgi:hypothetical protein
VIEEQVPHSTALHAHLAGGGRYLTGPLARYALGSRWLSPLAREAVRAAGLAGVGKGLDNAALERFTRITCSLSTRLIFNAVRSCTARPGLVCRSWFLLLRLRSVIDVCRCPGLALSPGSGGRRGTWVSRSAHRNGRPASRPSAPTRSPLPLRARQPLLGVGRRLRRVAEEFDSVHDIQRALRVGSVDHIIPAAELRPFIIRALERRQGLPIAPTPVPRERHGRD